MTSPSKRLLLTAGGILFFVIFIGGCGATSSMFHADKYRNLIGEVKESNFTSDVSVVDPDQMITVDEGIAIRVGEKVIGEQPGLGSRTELGEFTLQSVNGKLYWIAPLLHSGFFKWWNFSSEGSPGYVVVSATNAEDYRLVTKHNEKGITIKYQPNAYFSQDIERHIYTSGYMTKGFTEYNFEVDDNWNPYWTVTLYDSKVGFGGDDAVGVLVIDPATGNISEYALDNMPKWVDRVQPVDFVKTQADDWGELVHGWWNFGGKDKISITDDYSTVLADDGTLCYYIGLRSKGRENSTVGFMMVNSRTKEVKWYHQAGATEEAARQSAEGKVQQMGYAGSEGITYNIDGTATYEFLLKDKAGLMKQIALVSVHDHTIVGVGENRQQALRNYRAALSSHGNAVSTGPSDMRKGEIISAVSRIASDMNGTNTTYYLILTERKKNIFVGNTTTSIQIALTKEGDMVKVSFIENDRQEIEINSFENISLNLKNDTMLSKQEQSIGTVREGKRLEKENEVLDNKWEKLSPETKKSSNGCEKIIALK